jgi:hypothetical protein
MAGAEAYQILENMGQRLDRDLLREFQPISRVNTP